MVGMSGGIVLLIFMTPFLPLSHVVPFHGAVQLSSNATRVWLLRKHIRRDFVIPYIIGIPFGVIPSILFIEEFQSQRLAFFLIATLIFYALFRPKKLPPLKIHSHWFVILGVVAGFLALLIGAVGPFLAPFLIRDDLSKEEVVATKAVMQTFVHFIKIPSFLYLGFAYGDYLWEIVALIVAAWLGTQFGVRFLKGLRQDIFEKLFKGFMFIAGLRLYYKVFFLVRRRGMNKNFLKKIFSLFSSAPSSAPSSPSGGVGELNSIYLRFKGELPQREDREYLTLACLSGLLARIAFVDLNINEGEIQSMVKAVQETTKYPREVAEKVVRIARSEVEELVDHEHHLYTRPLNKFFGKEEKEMVLRLLFQVAAADGSVENLESEEIRRISKELRLSHRQFVQAKMTVRKKIQALKSQ